MTATMSKTINQPAALVTLMYFTLMDNDTIVATDTGETKVLDISAAYTLIDYYRREEGRAVPWMSARERAQILSAMCNHITGNGRNPGLEWLRFEAARETLPETVPCPWNTPWCKNGRYHEGAMGCEWGSDGYCEERLGEVFLTILDKGASPRITTIDGAEYRDSADARSIIAQLTAATDIVDGVPGAVERWEALRDDA